MSVIRLAADDGGLTRRQRALGMALDGLQDMQDRKDQKEATKRQRALETVQMGQKLGAQGVDPSQFKEGFQAYVETGDAQALGGIGSALSQAAQEQRAYEREQKRLDRENQRQDQTLSRQYKKAQISKLEESAKPKTAKDKLGSLGAEARNKIGSMVSGLQALNRVSKAIDDGYEPEYIDTKTPILGNFVSDNPFTENQRVLSEVVGRLQSGGAIQKEELNTFNSMGPRPGDDPNTIRRKLKNQREFLQNKLTSFGLTAEELPEAGFDYTPYQMKGPSLSPSQGSSILEANKAYASDPGEVQNQVKSMSREQKLKLLMGQ